MTLCVLIDSTAPSCSQIDISLGLIIGFADKTVITPQEQRLFTPLQFDPLRELRILDSPKKWQKARYMIMEHFRW